MTFDIFMSGGGWVLSAFISMIFAAFIYLFNQYIKMPGDRLVFWSRILIIIFMTPFMFYIDWPTKPIFYLAVIATAFAAAFADMRTFNVSAKYGGGVLSRTLPLVIFLSFPIWFLFDPALFFEYISTPFKAIGILSTLVGCVYFSSRLKKCNISHAAFIAMLPALIGYTVNTVLNKFAMGQGPHEGVIFCYMYVQSIATIPLLTTYHFLKKTRPKKKESLKIEKRTLLVASTLALLWISSMVFKNAAMIFVPNPAYQVVIGQLSPVLIALFYWVTKHKEEADVLSGFGIVICAVLLAVLTV